jgi:hypothetical protein
MPLDFFGVHLVPYTDKFARGLLLGVQAPKDSSGDQCKLATNCQPRNEPQWPAQELCERCEVK